MNAVKALIKNLQIWYQNHQRSLPWRDVPSFYRVWISEIMLQQTQVAAVIPYFERFLARFPTLEVLSAASVDQVLEYWAGLGYYNRARNLHQCGQILARMTDLPATREELESLPGIGAYTAGAILSIALNQVEPILDANVKKVLSRMRRIKGGTQDKKRLWRLAKLLVQEGAKAGMPPRDFNQALMEIGALVCLPRRPLCVSCPLALLCKASKEGDPEIYPARQRKNWEKVEETVYFILGADDNYLLHKRGEKQWRAGLWDLPEHIPARLLPEENWERGSLVSSHVVTHHKITRTIIYIQLHGNLEDYFKGEETDYTLINIHYPEWNPVALGAAGKKDLKKIKDRFFDRADDIQLF